MITKDMTLADVVKAYPNTIGFLNGLHLITAAAAMTPSLRLSAKRAWT